eukprot:scaffold146575_cov40-Prasinocladus_malaysianus.AAC.1
MHLLLLPFTLAFGAVSHGMRTYSIEFRASRRVKWSPAGILHNSGPQQTRAGLTGSAGINKTRHDFTDAHAALPRNSPQSRAGPWFRLLDVRDLGGSFFLGARH